MIKSELQQELRAMLDPEWYSIHEYIHRLNDVIDGCTEQEDREELSVAIDHINLAIISMTKVLNRNKKGEQL